MPKFLVTYHGGGMPTDPAMAQQAAAAFQAWAQGAGTALVDPGAPLRPSSQVGSPTAAAEVAGYSVLEAESADAAVEILKSHPFVARGGTLQLHEAMVP